MVGMGNEYNFMISNSKYLFCRFPITCYALP